jgi:hypothetical protein
MKVGRPVVGVCTTDNKAAAAYAASGRFGETGANGGEQRSERGKPKGCEPVIAEDRRFGSRRNVDMEGPCQVIREAKEGARGVFDDASC